jgi:hypothetical protein
MVVSSAGYLGAMTYGALAAGADSTYRAARLVWLARPAVVFRAHGDLRRGKADHGRNLGNLERLPFTLAAGLLISAGLFAGGSICVGPSRDFSGELPRGQCVLNALLDLKTVFFLSSPSSPPFPRTP